MVANRIGQAHTLVPGRAGELTLSANHPTFTLLERIFGRDGPYRRVLQRAGVRVVETSASFLVLVDGTVYTDVAKEAAILWGNYPYTPVISENRVVYRPHLTLRDLPKIWNLLAKSLQEAKTVVSVKTVLTEAHAIYTEISRKVQEVFDRRQLSAEEFLSLYEGIVRVTYLYELFVLYNSDHTLTPQLKRYVAANDYLLADSHNFIEHYLRLDRGFYLDAYPNLAGKLAKLPVSQFVPAALGRIDPATPRTAEVELQCLKNNLRLKTNVLLYFLNLTMLQTGEL